MFVRWTQVCHLNILGRLPNAGYAVRRTQCRKCITRFDVTNRMANRANQSKCLFTSAAFRTWINEFMSAKIKVPTSNGPIDFNKPVRRLIYEDLKSGQKRQFDLYISPERTDQFKVLINGRVWKERIGWTHILAAIRKTATGFFELPI